jgi:hypothetical protein
MKNNLAKLQSSLILKKRPKTSIYELSRENNNRNNISSSLSRNVSSAKSSISNLIQFKKTDTKQQDTINYKRKKSIKFNNEEEDEDDNMTNITLLSVNSYETIRPKRLYGKFQTFSLFERYMNRRAKIKLQPHMNPKLPPEYQNQPEPTLFDLLSDDELSILYDMYKIDVAVPFRLRSFSVAFDRTLFTYSSKNKIKKRSNSVEKSTNVKITNENEIQSKDIKSYMQKSSKVNDNESGDFDLDRSTSPSFDTKGIKGPIIYQIGSSDALSTTPKSNKIENQKKNNPLKNMDLFNINNILSTRTKAYDHVKSNLESIFHDSPKIKENSLINYSKSALDRHKETFTPYIKYNKIQTKSLVQMSELLENKIRENLKMNRGPIYYGQFTQENIRLHNKNKQKLKRQDKFYNIYEWLEKIDVKQCSHFFMNPFKRDKNNLTDECDLNLNWREAARKADMSLIRFKIDPFDNPKNITTKLESKRNERFFGGIQTYYQTFDQQTLIAKKDYTNLLHLEPTLFNRKNNMIDFKNNDDLISSASSNYRKNYALDQRANLKKQKFLNDSYLLRMQLDLYIL